MNAWKKILRPPNALGGKGKVPVGPESSRIWSFTHAGPRVRARDFDNPEFCPLEFCPIKNGAGVVTLHMHWKYMNRSQQPSTPLITCLPQPAGFRPSM